MAELDKALDSFLKDVKKLVPDINDKQKISAAGAAVYKQHLHDVTKAKHYTANRDTSKVKHLADSIEMDTKNIDGIVDGSALVGFTFQKINHARIARFLNDGTKFTKDESGLHFVDNARRESRHAVLAAEYEVYKRLKKGGD